MEDQAYIKNILANLDDNAPRLAFANQLTAAGDPRGDFIEMQCQLHTMLYYDLGYWRMLRASEDLLQSHRREWLGGFDDEKEWIQFMRGFPGYSAIAAPFVESLQLLDRFPTINGVMLQSEETFAEYPIGPATLEAMRQGKTPPMKRSTVMTDIRRCTDKLLSIADRLHSVSAYHPSHFEELFESIFRDDRWQRIEYFSCYGPSWSDERLLNFLQSRLWDQLRVVTLRGIPPLERFINAVRQMPATLIRDISLSDLNKAVMDTFVQGGKLEQLKRISLYESSIRSIESLASGVALPKLEYLSCTPLATEDVSTLLTWELGAKIKALRMSMTQLPVDFFPALMQSHFHSLNLLEIKPDLCHADSLRSFVESDFARGLTLHLNSIPSELLTSIANASFVDDLRINLALETASDDAIDALIETELHSHITVFNIWNGTISKQALQKLIDFGGFPLLESANMALNVDDVPESITLDLEDKFGPNSVTALPSMRDLLDRQ